MCSSSRERSAAASIVAAIALLAAIPGTRLHAQATPESTAEYRQLVDRLAERWRRLAQADSQLQAGPSGKGGVRLDTLRFGTLTLILPPTRAAVAAAIGRAAWDSIKAEFGADTLALSPQSIEIGGGRGRRGTWFSDPGLSREYQESYGLSLILGIVRQAESERFEVDSTAESWVASTLRAMLFTSDSVQRAVTYMELATQPWVVVRACFDGDLEACRRALSLPSTPDSMALLFTAAERRRLVAQHATSWTELGRAPGTTRCVEAGVDSACVDLFRRFPGAFPERPLSPLARATLLRTVVDLGGDGWYTSLLSASGPDYLARLSAVAEISPEALLQAWRTRVMSAKPEPMTLSRLAGWIAFLWAAVFTVVATRSSRWRRD
jgi:hypothetical protein